MSRITALYVVALAAAYLLGALAATAVYSFRRASFDWNSYVMPVQLRIALWPVPLSIWLSFRMLTTPFRLAHAFGAWLARRRDVKAISAAPSDFTYRQVKQ